MGNSDNLGNSAELFANAVSSFGAAGNFTAFFASPLRYTVAFGGGPQTVPEPESVALVGLGIAAIAVARRKWGRS